VRTASCGFPGFPTGARRAFFAFACPIALHTHCLNKRTFQQKIRTRRNAPLIHSKNTSDGFTGMA
jgi:hypothetical protein